MTSSQTFNPNWASAPGDTIRDVLDHRAIELTDFADQMALTVEATTDLLEGRSTITLDLARRLKDVLGASVEFWMARDHQFRADTSRLRNTEQEWIRDIPVGDMIRFGWLDRPPHPSQEVSACLKFFGVTNVTAWRREYAGLTQMAAFRTSRTFDSKPGAIAAWLRQGEIQAHQIVTGKWDSTEFENALREARSLTRRRDPALFLPELTKLCAKAGVALVIVRAPSGCRASGAVRLLSSEKALLQLSFRYLSDDQFWFTFFHEAGHLLLHWQRILILQSLRGDQCGVVEGADALSEAEEKEANDFAAGVLIPAAFHAELLALRPDSMAITRFAVRTGISPGIVVGQLQHLSRIGPEQLNHLKRRYKWS